MGSDQAYPPHTLDAGPLELRRITATDGPSVAEAVAASLEGFRPWMPWATEEATTVQAQTKRAREAVALWEDGTDYIYLGHLPGNSVVVGSFGLHRRLDASGIEIGYWVHTAYGGNGYGTYGARALTAAALDMPGIHRVEIHCDQANQRSRAIPERLGYRLDRIEHRDPATPGESGKHLIWIMP